MPKHRRSQSALPPCYATVLPGLEPIAADEIAEFGGSVRKTQPGLVVFRAPEVTADLFSLRTVEDVYLFAWGTDSLTYRAQDLKSIEQWTAREVDWQQLLHIHHSIHPIRKGRPSYRVVAQMTGKHGYLRSGAGDAVRKGLTGKFPPGWQQVRDEAHLEIWLTIHGSVAVCGVRLSDKTMRHRTYKVEHLPASLRPTVAAAMVRLAETPPGAVVLDPACGAGTILAEQIELSKARRVGRIETWGGDLDGTAILAAAANLKRVGPTVLARWDVARLPLADQSVDRLICNPPFGKQLASPEALGPLYEQLTQEGNRVLKPGGRAVLLVSDADILREAAREVRWIPRRQVRVVVLGQRATIGVWQKPGGSLTVKGSSRKPSEPSD